jgi:hypothetical protein
MGISSGLGNALVPTSYGFRNEIINGNFMINQRAYASGTNLASGAYGFDRWKSNQTNTSLTFTSAPQGQIVTMNFGGVLRQIVERANIVAGSYVLSWTGNAVGRVYNEGATGPSYQSSPFSVVLDGTANVIVEFTSSTGSAVTLGNVQLEFGSRATPFEHRLVGVELSLCQRYFQTYREPRLRGAIGSSGTPFRMGMVIPPMRTAPTSSIIGGTIGIFDGSTASTPTFSIGNDYTLQNHSVEYDLGGSGFNNFRPAMVYYTGATGILNLSAEL